MARRRLPRLEVIEAFLEAARAPNFRTAAERCALSSTAFTRRIQAFKNFVGCDVFERHAGGMRLTDAGREYLLALEPAYREMKLATLEIAADQRCRTVTVSLSHSLAVGWLIPRLPRFRATHAKFDVQIRTGRTAQSIRSGDVDLGMCAIDVDVAGLHVERLIDVNILPVACPQVATEIAKGAKAFDDFPLLGLSHRPDLWSWWAKAANVKCSALHESTRFDMAHALYESAAGGLGLAIGLRALLGPHLQSGRLVDLDMPCILYPGGYRLVARHNRIGNPTVATFCAWLREEARFANRHERARRNLIAANATTDALPDAQDPHGSASHRDTSKQWPTRHVASGTLTLDT